MRVNQNNAFPFVSFLITESEVTHISFQLPKLQNIKYSGRCIARICLSGEGEGQYKYLRVRKGESWSSRVFDIPCYWRLMVWLINAECWNRLINLEFNFQATPIPPIFHLFSPPPQTRPYIEGRLGRNWKCFQELQG